MAKPNDLARAIALGAGLADLLIEVLTPLKDRVETLERENRELHARVKDLQTAFELKELEADLAHAGPNDR